MKLSADQRVFIWSSVTFLVAALVVFPLIHLAEGDFVWTEVLLCSAAMIVVFALAALVYLFGSHIFNLMKRLFVFALVLASVSAFGQQRQQDRGNSSMLTFPIVSTRTEIILPEVNGYKVVKTDLHVHTVYSDGRVTPEYRIKEAWQDGLDAIAITDHIEVRPNEKTMKKFLADGITEKKVANGVVSSDMNVSVSDAESKARQLGITLISGIEITREPVLIGHFNALFTTDNNLIPDPDPLQAVRNAKKQGALVQNNHPGWRRTDNSFTSATEAAIAEGLIDGVEVFNSYEFYPDVIETAVSRGFYVSCGSDIHATSHDDYGRYGKFRDMTLVLAKDSSPESIREALESCRTLAYAYGDVAGGEDLLKDFFKASFSFDVVYTDSKGVKSVLITNKSSFPYVLTLPGFSVDITVDGFSSVICKCSGDLLPVGVQNMWFGSDKHPVVEIGI